MLRRLRFALAPGWLALHLITAALIVTMVLLGRWQLDVSNAKHFNLQNFGYALQWWAFSAFVLAMWLRVLLDARRRHHPEIRRQHPETAASGGPQPAEPAADREPPVAYRRYVMPQSTDAPAPATDSEYAAYNDYLSRLAADTAQRAGREGRTQ